MNREERVLKYINSSDDFLVDGKRYCENDFYNDVEDLAKENKILKERINKTIEYIENHSLYEEEYDYDYEENSYLSGINDETTKKDLLEILRGDINE